MISIKVLLTLLAVHSCFKLSRGQIVGPASKDATEEERTQHFKSQVLVETFDRWEPTDDVLRSFPRNIIEDMIELPPSRFKFRGSGTILSSRWVLTAAHNFKTLYELAAFKGRQQHKKLIRSATEQVRVVAGQLAKQPAGNTHRVVRVILNGDYFRHQQTKGDIALLQLSADLNFRAQLFDKMNLPPYPEFPGMECKMSGWGMTDAGRESQTLRWANTKIVGHTQTTWNKINNPNTDLFAVGINNQQPINQRAATGPGDSGSGLLCQRYEETYVFGVAMGSVRTVNNEDYPLEQLGTADLPTLYTSVHKNLPWIKKWMALDTSIPNMGDLLQTGD